MTTYDNLEMFSNDSTATTLKSMPKNQASAHWRPNTYASYLQEKNLQQPKVNAILHVTPPHNVKQVRSFVSMLNITKQ
jgi:hypothetical protein